jgi:hypothetical protein
MVTEVGYSEYQEFGRARIAYEDSGILCLNKDAPDVNQTALFSIQGQPQENQVLARVETKGMLTTASLSQHTGLASHAGSLSLSPLAMGLHWNPKKEFALWLWPSKLMRARPVLVFD